ncbi:MAG: hypothetical protein GXP29_10595, partial [Planctomycetes bacterium]|nr:hypothetical protein [Planctomycetota bacterium]
MLTINRTVAVRAFAAFFCVAVVSCSVFGQPAGPESSRIRWRSGEVTTTLKTPPETAADLMVLSLSRASAKHVVVQFDAPVTDAQRAVMRAAGLNLLNYAGDNAFFAAFQDAGLNQDAMRNVPSLRAALAIQRNWKLHPSLVRDEIHPWAIVAGKKKGASGDKEKSDAPADETVVAVYVLFHPDINLDAKAPGIVFKHGARIQSLMRSINGLVIELPATQIKSLADEDGVQYIEPPLPQFANMNDSNRVITGADIVQAAPYDLDGSGVSVLIYDGGEVLASHPDFGGRATVRDSSGLSDHSTHVAGTVGGDG